MGDRESGFKNSLSSSLSLARPLRWQIPAVCGSAFVIFPEVWLL